MASSEWDDTGNTEVTSGSVSETWSQASSSHSDLSAKDILGNVAESSAGQGIQHVCDVGWRDLTVIYGHNMIIVLRGNLA